MKRLGNRMKKESQSALFGNIIGYNEVIEELELTDKGQELLNENKYKRIPNGDINTANKVQYGIDHDGNFYAIEIYEYQNVDKNDSNYGKIISVIAYKQIDVQTEKAVWLIPKIEIQNCSANNAKLSNMSLVDNEDINVAKKRKQLFDILNSN